MTSRLLTLLTCLAFSLALPACAEDQKTDLTGTVTWVYDGDTLEVEPFGTVRLIGIDAPERENSRRDRYLEKMGVPPAKQREIYRIAKEFNITHTKGAKVGISPGSPERDRHDRLLAYVYLQDGRLLNTLLIEEGLAVVYRRFDFGMEQQFLDTEAQAQKNRKGLWSAVSGPENRP